MALVARVSSSSRTSGGGWLASGRSAVLTTPMLAVHRNGAVMIQPRTRSASADGSGVVNGSDRSVCGRQLMPLDRAQRAFFRGRGGSVVPGGWPKAYRSCGCPVPHDGGDQFGEFRVGVLQAWAGGL